MLRSLLFAPGDSSRKLLKASEGSADALILDLEDSVAASAKPAARSLVAEFLNAHPDRGRQQLWVRINPLDGGLALTDLAAVVEARPDGIMLPKAEGAASVARVSHYLDALEARAGLPQGEIGVLAVATETAKAMFTLGSYADLAVGHRLKGLAWGAEDISAALHASNNRGDDGQLDFTYQMARSMCLIGARAAGVLAIETVFTDFRDIAGLEAWARTAQREGFDAMMAIHPDQVAAINQAFSPTPEALAHARVVVAAFDAQPGAGTVSLDGRMLDLPHLVQARRVIEAAQQAGQ
jgi:citrate lyase subunit beta / citryl-CoA lyase